MTPSRRRRLLLALVTLETVGAAIVLWQLFLGSDEQLPGPTPTAAASATETAAADAAASRLGVWLAPDMPPFLTGAIGEWVAGWPGELDWSESPTSGGPTAFTDVLTVGWERRGRALALVQIILVPVAAFPSLRDGVSMDELRRLWQGHPRPGDATAILITAETANATEGLLGPHSPQSPVVVPDSELADRLWSDPSALALVPFDHLEPRLKVLPVDGLSALERSLDLHRYPLVATVWVSGPDGLVDSLTAEIQARGLEINRRPGRLSVVLMTGVTALTRGVAFQMEARGDPAWPARPVANLLSAADLTHVSNEVSFVPGCEPEADTWVFCAKPESLATLQLVGADIVELTGNHNLDFGPYYAELSLDLYAEAGMQTFGGGRDPAAARQPVLITHNGNRLAFLGYNQFGPDYAWASSERPGAARFSPEAVRSDVAQVRSRADLVVVTIQHTETYDAIPLPQQVADFRLAIQAGADLVVGSQAHQPQAIEFQEGKPIFYGLGNLFFDQTWSEATRQGLIVRHFVYDGRLIAIELIPTVIDDAFQTHLAESDEADAILQGVFAASGW